MAKGSLRPGGAAQGRDRKVPPRSGLVRGPLGGWDVPGQSFFWGELDVKKLVIWDEDDATVGQNDHEFLEHALKRIFGLERASEMLEKAKKKIEDGFGTRYELKLVINSSYPGNSSITVEPMP